MNYELEQNYANEYALCKGEEKRPQLFIYMFTSHISLYISQNKV